MINDEKLRIIEEHIGKQLRVKRVKRGLTLAAIASKIGISHQQVQKYEQAQSRISAAMLYKFANIYGIGVEQFFEDVKNAVRANNNQTKTIIDPNHTREIINILMVEDNPGDEAITRKALENFPRINLLCVHDGLQATEVLRYKTLCPEFPKPDLILLDISLPKKDGISLLKDIKRDRDLQEIPVVILTNNISADVMINAYKAGASGYICKSFEYETYRDNLNDCVKYWTKTVVLPT